MIYALCMADEIPATPGVYPIQTVSGKVRYVGSTKNLKKRYRDHLRRLIKGQHPNRFLQKTFNLNRTVMHFKIVTKCLERELVRLEAQDMKGSYKYVKFLNRQQKSGSGHYGHYTR